MDESSKQWWIQWGKNLRDVRRYVLRTLVVAIIQTILLLLARKYGLHTFDFMVRVLGRHYAQLVIGIVVVVLGILAHRFKRRNQRWYGIVEVIFGAATGFSIAFGMSPGRIVLAQWASLIGCAYVVARGLNNISEAKMNVMLGP